MCEPDFSSSFPNSILYGLIELGALPLRSKVQGIQGQDSSSELLGVPAQPGV